MLVVVVVVVRTGKRTIPRKGEKVEGRFRHPTFRRLTEGGSTADFHSARPPPPLEAATRQNIPAQTRLARSIRAKSRIELGSAACRRKVEQISRLFNQCYYDLDQYAGEGVVKF